MHIAKTYLRGNGARGEEHRCWNQGCIWLLVLLFPSSVSPFPPLKKWDNSHFCSWAIMRIQWVNTCKMLRTVPDTWLTLNECFFKLINTITLNILFCILVGILVDRKQEVFWLLIIHTSISFFPSVYVYKEQLVIMFPYKCFYIFLILEKFSNRNFHSPNFFLKWNWSSESWLISQWPPNISFLHNMYTQCIIGTEIFPPLWSALIFFHTGASKETICDLQKFSQWMVLFWSWIHSFCGKYK